MFYELLLTKEKFYKGARGYVCLRTGTGPQAWIVLLYRGSCSRIMDHRIALPLRALRRGGGTDVFVTTCQRRGSIPILMRHSSNQITLYHSSYVKSLYLITHSS